MSRLAHLLLVALGALATLFVLGSAEAGTTVPAQTISANATWTLAGSPYNVTGAVTVAGAAVPVLSVEPGVQVQFGTSGSLVIGSGSNRGALVANGTATDPILFTSLAANKSRGDWNYLRFDTLSTSPTSFLENVTVEYAGRSSRTAIEIVEGPVSLANVTVRESAWAGVYVDNVAPRLVDVTLTDNARWGLYAEADGRPTLENVAIRRTGNVPLRVRLDQSLAGLTLGEDAVRRIEWWGLDVTTNRTHPAVFDATTSQRYDDALLSGFEIRNGAVWTLQPGARLLAENFVGINVGTWAQKGSLKAEGTEADPIYLGSLSGSTTNGWYGLYFRGDGGAPLGESVFRNATVAYARDDGFDLYAYSGLLLDNVTTRNNGQRGIALSSASPTLRNVDALDNGWEAMFFTYSAPTWRGGHVNGTGRSGLYASGCGIATLEDLTIERTASYGFFADGGCNGAHLDGVRFVNVTNRAWRNRIDLRHDVHLLERIGVSEIEYWGADLVSNQTLTLWQNETGGDLTTVILSGVEVRNGATLTIPARSRVLFDNGAWMNTGTWAQKGSLKAEGTEAEPITMGSRSGSSTNGWYGLYFRGDGGAPLGETVLRNVTLYGSRDDAIEAYAYAGAFLDNLTARDNAARGVYLHAGSNFQMRNFVARDNGWEGLTFSTASPVVRGGLIEGTGRSSIWSAGCSVATLENVTLRDSASYGYWSNDGCAGAHFDGVRIENVSNRAWRNRLDLREDVTIDKAGVDEVEYWGNDLLTDRTLTPWQDAYDGAQITTVILSGFDVRAGAVLTVPAGSTILFGDGAFINTGTWGQKGSLKAEGTEAEPIVLRSRSGSITNGWYGLYFRGDGGAPLGESVLRNATLSYSRDDAVDAYAYSGLLLDNVTLQDNGRYGLRIDSGSPALRNVDVLRSGWEGAFMSYASPTWNGGSIVDSQRSGLYTAGCGYATLVGVTIQDANGYGHYSDGPCNGVHHDGVTIRDVTNRPWRNRLDARYDVAVENASVLEVEYWGTDLLANKTLLTWTNGPGGPPFVSVVLSGFEIRNGAVWTIPAGTRVLWGDGSYVNVGTWGQKGSLKAEGTEAEPIFLLSRSGSSTNGWYGLYFRGDGGAPLGESALRNATLAYSRDDALDVYYYNGVALDNLTLDANARYGVRLQGVSVTLRHVDVSRSGYESSFWESSSPTWIGSRLNHSARSGIYTSGCGMGRLVDVVIDSPNGWGFYSDWSCNGAHFDGVTILNATNRAWRNRLDARDDATVRNASLDEVEYWGNDLTSNKTLALHTDQLDGARLTSVILSGFEVRNGAVWTIPAGSRILWGDGAYVNVGTWMQKASLQAEGVVSDPIYMGSRSGSSTNGWYGLYFRGDSAPLGETVLRNVTIAFSRDDGIEAFAYSGALFDNVTLDRNARHGLYIHSGSPTLRNVVVLRPGFDGMFVSYASPTWRGGRIERAGRHGVFTSGCGAATLEDVTIDTPAQYGLWSDWSCNGAHLDGVRFVNLTTYPWRNRLDLRDDATVENATVRAVEYWGNDIASNRTLAALTNGTGGARLDARLLGTFEVRNGATLTLPAGTRLLAADSVNFQVGTCAQQGSLRVEGTAAEPVYLGSVSNSTSGGWSGLYFRGDCGAAQGSSVLRNVTIAHSRDHGLDTYYYGGLSVDNATIRNNAWDGIHVHGNAAGAPTFNATSSTRNGANGLWVEFEGIAIHRSNLSDNGYNGLELRNTAGVTLRDTTALNNTRAGANVTWHPGNLDARRTVFWRNAGFGVDLQGSSGNTVVDNAFIENVVGQARTTAMNTWNVSKTEGRNVAYGPFLGGNSWSDYAGEDTDGDGLGDTLVPYATNLGPGRDWLPVMGNLYADFNVSIPDIVNLPRQLVFTDASRGGFSPTDQWIWDFGDGGQAFTDNVTHDFASDGTYPVQLTVANPHGQISQVTKNVVVDAVQPLSNATLNGTLGLGGWYVSGVNVTLAASDDRAGVSVLRYRLDGGAWLTYTTRFPVLADGAHVVEHYAVDRNGNQEPVRNVTFRIDRTLPTLADASVSGTLGNASWYVSDVLVTLAGNDTTSGLARIDHAWGATPNATYAGPVTLAQDGTFLLRWRAVDNAGNVGPERNLTLRRDATVPSIVGNESGLLGGSGWYVGPVTVNLTGADETSGLRHLNASVDSGPWFEVTGPFEVEGHGIHTVNATATDAAGNLLDAPARTVRIDLTTPVSEHHFEGTLGANGWFVTDVNVTFTGNDTGSGIAAYVYSLDDGPNATYEGPVRVAQNGQHRLVYHAVDAAGNAETVHEVILYLDLAAPTTRLNVTGPVGANGWWLGNVSASIEAENATNLAQILYRLDGGSELEFLAPFAIAGEGVHNVTWHGVSVGGLEEEERSSLVRLDLTDPSLALTLNGTLGANGWYVSPVQAALLVADGASGIATTLVRVDGGAETTYTGPVSLSTTGVHNVSGRTLDVAGRATDLANTEVRVDVSDPVTTLTKTPPTPDGANGWYRSVVTVSLGATDAGAGVEHVLVSVDGAPEAPVEDLLALGEGVHTLAYRAVDLAGRVETLRTEEIKIDLTAPALSNATEGAAGLAGWFTSAVNVTLSASDATSGVGNLTASVDGGAWLPVNGTLRLTTTGVHNVSVRAVDVAGLLSTETLTVKIDLAAPVTSHSVSGSANGFGWRTSSPTVTLSATDAGSGVAGIQFSLDGAPFQPYAGPFAVPEGFHNLTFFAVDVAGLAETVRAPVPINVDLTDPETGALGFRPADHASGWHLAPVLVNLTGADGPSGLRDFQYWVNGSGPSTAAGASLTHATEGLRALTVAARDFAGRLDATLAAATLRVDLNPPVSTHTLTPGHVAVNRSVRWHNADATFTMASTDAGAGVAGRLVRVDGVESAYAGPIAFTQDGVYNLSYYATDLVDRIEALKTVPTFGIDRAPPVTTPTIDGSQDVDGVYKTEVNVTLAALDALSGVLNGPTGLQWRLDGGAFQTYAGPIHLAVSGNYTLDFRARDVVGNVEPLQTLTLDLFVDTTPPVVDATLLGPLGPGGWYGGNVTVRLNATDVQSSVQSLLYRIDGGDLVTLLGDRADLALSAEGPHVVEYAALDIAGNLAAFRNVTFSIDATPPTLDLSAAFTEGRDGWIVSPVNLTPIPADALSGVHHVEAKLDAGAWSAFTGIYTLAQERNHTVLLRAIDAAGLFSPIVSWSGKLDLTAPTLRHAFSGPQGLDGWYRENVSVALVTSIEDVSGVLPIQYRFDGSDWQTYPGQAIQFVAEGNHTLSARVEDVAGNLAALGPFNLGLDRTRPQVTTTLDGATGEAGWWVGPVQIDTAVVDLPGTPGVNVSGVHQLTRIVDGGANLTVGVPDALGLNVSGVHLVRYFALDRALNGLALDLTVPVDLDDPILDVDVSGPEGLDGWFRGPVLVNATALDATSGPSRILMERDGVVENVTGPILLATEGVHAFALRAVDVAGRLGDDAPLDVRIDATPPDLTALADGPRGVDDWFVGATRVTLDARDLVSGVREITYVLNDGAATVYDGAIDLTESGTWALNYTGLDVAGNAVTGGMVLRLDVEAPEANVTIAGVQAANSSWYSSGVTITLDATDPTSGVATLEYTFDLNASWLPYAGPLELSAEGVHTLHYRAIDESGRPSIVYSHEIRIDLTTPVVGIRLESTLYTEIDGRIYVSGEFCVEVSGIDAISGLRSAVIRLAGSVTELIELDLTVALHCFDTPDLDEWEILVTYVACDHAGFCGSGGLWLYGGGGGGGGGDGAAMSFVRPFRGALNVQKASVPVFSDACPETGVAYDTGIHQDVTDPEDPSDTMPVDVVLTTPRHPVCDTTVVFGTQVPVWVTGWGINPQAAQLYLDGVLVAETDVSEVVGYERLSAYARATADGLVEPELERENVTQRLFVFHLDTLNLTAGEHTLLAKGIDRKGRIASGGLPLVLVTPAAGEYAVSKLEGATSDGDVPGPAPAPLPRTVDELLPDDVTPDLPPEVRAQLDAAYAAARLVLGALDRLYLDTYALVDDDLLALYETIERALADAGADAGPTLGDTDWGASAPTPDDVLPG